jgi:hypothetical protein
MKFFLTGICILIFHSVIAQVQFDFTPLKDQDIIYWSENQRLKWMDFKGRQWKLDARARAQTAGTISTSIDVHGDVLIITSRSIFSRTHSAVRSGSETTIILEHEQLHFDIFELFCRKLKKAISDHGSFKKGAPGFELEKIKIEINRICRETQNLYDEEVKQSPEKQKDWVNKIAVELESLKKFQNPVVRVPLTD